MNILILCTGNSCRSQMAHGILQSFNREMKVQSAGTNPASEVHPKAIKAMEELGIDISHHRPHHVDEYIDQKWDFVITVCGNADENCPIFSGEVKFKLHMGFADPSETKGTDTEVLNEFKKIRNQILVEFYTFYNKIIRPEF